MWEKIKTRASNLFELVTSKKALVVLGAALAIWVLSSPAKILAIGGIAVAYVVAQGLIDIQKEKNKKDDVA
jgi:hypothetical protein